MNKKIDSTSLSQKLYSATQVLENEARVAAQHQLTLLQLMEKAGHAVFEHIHKFHQEINHLIILVGKGNNGGDGLVIAKLALQAGYKVSIRLFINEKQLKGDAKTVFERLDKTKVNFINDIDKIISDIQFSRTDKFMVIDSIFGIGFHGELPVDIAQETRKLNTLNNIVVVAVDTPTGVNVSTGHCAVDALVANETVTFIAPKQGLYTGTSSNVCGKIYLADLGVGQTFQQIVPTDINLQQAFSSCDYPYRRPAAHKGESGLLICCGGNQGMPGAIRLASEAALRAGAGLVSVYCHQTSQPFVVNNRPELMLTLATALSAQLKLAKALLCGPGLGQDDWAKHVFSEVLKQPVPMVVDADGLNLLSQCGGYRENWVLTPHPKEAARLLATDVETIEADRFAAVKAIAKRYGGICVLKGAGSLISDGQTVWVNSTGNSGMATGGMGDVLSGIIAALMMQCHSLLVATRLSVYLHGLAADKIAQQQGSIGMLASDLFEWLPRLINRK
ncbi:NAD(P)H-hydrate dehydratase [Thalassotalea ganghwensis]